MKLQTSQFNALCGCGHSNGSVCESLESAIAFEYPQSLLLEQQHVSALYHNLITYIHERRSPFLNAIAGPGTVTSARDPDFWDFSSTNEKRRTTSGGVAIQMYYCLNLEFARSF